MDILRLEAGRGVMAFSTLRGESAVSFAGNRYDGFNVCHYTGDDSGHVAQCRSELARYAGVEADHLVIPRQTHSVNTAVIGDEMPDLYGVDALVTCRDDVALVVNTADCLPIVFNDSRHGVIGIAHGGWRGLYNGIIESAVEAMTGLGAECSDMRVAIGPCICGACYEVDGQFAGRFEARFGARVLAPVAAGERPHVDLRAVAVGLLERCGIDRSGIFVSGVCSKCDERLFSARRLGVQSGRIATVVKKVAE